MCLVGQDPPGAERMKYREQNASGESSMSGSIADRFWRRGYVPAELIAGATAGGLAAFVLLPIDTVKVGRVQWRYLIEE